MPYCSGPSYNGAHHVPETRHLVARGARGPRLSRGGVVPAPHLQRQGVRQLHPAAPRRTRIAVQGEGHLPRLGTVATRREQLARREGRRQGPRRQEPFAAAPRAPHPDRAGDRRRRLPPPVRGLLPRRGRAHPRENRGLSAPGRHYFTVTVPAGPTFHTVLRLSSSPMSKRSSRGLPPPCRAA